MDEDAAVVMARDDGSRRCGWCRGDLDATARRDAVYCSQRCRQAAHRFRQGLVARARARRPMRFAYADPPYPGLARRYYGRPEVDHGELVERLVAEFPDGWALSTSARALPAVLALCPPAVRVGAWFRGPRPALARAPLVGWEPVVFAGGRRVLSRRPGVDALIHRARPRVTDPGRVVGAKPAEFCWWLFDLLAARPGDELVDLFPGSGGVSRAWALYASGATSRDTSRVDLVDESRVDVVDGWAA